MEGGLSRARSRLRDSWSPSITFRLHQLTKYLVQCKHYLSGPMPKLGPLQSARPLATPQRLRFSRDIFMFVPVFFEDTVLGEGGFFRGPWSLCFSRDIFMFVPLLTERRS